MILVQQYRFGGEKKETDLHGFSFYAFINNHKLKTSKEEKRLISVV